MGKGGSFERATCVKLSLWWAGREDVFWRSSMSGGRATVRRRKMKTTSGSYGDVAAIDPIGLPLLDLVTIELKKGYSKDCFHSLLDKQHRAAQQAWESWIQQATEAWEQSGSFSWIIIAERNCRESVVMMPDDLVQVLKAYGCFRSKPKPFLTMVADVLFKYWTNKAKRKFRTESKMLRFSVMTLDSFLECVTRPDVKHLVRRVV